MKNAPTPAEINSLFANGNPEEAWPKAVEIIGRINPAYDFRIARTAFDDVVRLFRGEYPGYCPIRTLYHDLHHTGCIPVRCEADARGAYLRHPAG